MCVVSMIMDHYGDDWQKRWEEYERQRREAEKSNPPVPIRVPMPSQQELEEFRRLLERAREYDKRNNEPDCELDSKKQKLLDLAKQLGVEISFV